ncbi:MAG: SDR family oxidoreductase [Betaproteobacteria bacterium]|nr:SDR family oxidoreductase [Betaproteobacteria bacterium]
MTNGLFDVRGRIALVTGASSGLGRHFAKILAQQGALVALAARRVERLSEAVEEIEAGNGRAIAVPMDVSERASVCEALDYVSGKFGVPRILVNNAGVSDTKRALEYTDEDWSRVVGTNLTGAWIVAQETARRMVEAKIAGSIINITSILANRVAGGVSPYIAAKAGLKHLTQALALELARHDIRVNSIAPGYILTELNNALLGSEAGEKLKARIPTRRFGNVGNLDGALMLLASDAGAYMSGSEIVVDGGHSCNTL